MSIYTKWQNLSPRVQSWGWFVILWVGSLVAMTLFVMTTRKLLAFVFGL